MATNYNSGLDNLNHEHHEGGIKSALMTIRKHGYITPKQVLSFFKDMGETYTQKEVDNLIYELDIKDRDTLDLREFLTLIQLQLQVHDTEEEVVEAFKVFDKDQSGFLDCSELRRIMVNLGDKLTDDEVDLVIVQSDLDGDGSCNYEEFTRILMTERKFITRSERERQAAKEEEERFQKERKERIAQNKVVIVEKTILEREEKINILTKESERLKCMLVEHEEEINRLKTEEIRVKELWRGSTEKSDTEKEKRERVIYDYKQILTQLEFRFEQEKKKLESELLNLKKQLISCEKCSLNLLHPSQINSGPPPTVSTSSFSKDDKDHQLKDLETELIVTKVALAEEKNRADEIEMKLHSLVVASERPWYKKVALNNKR